MNSITYHTLTFDMCLRVAELIKVCFPEMPAEEQYSQEELEEISHVFPEGTIVAYLTDGLDRKALGRSAQSKRGFKFDWQLFPLACKAKLCGCTRRLASSALVLILI